MTGESPEDIERRLAQDRAALGETIDAIQERLSPGQLVDQAIGYFTGGSVSDGASDMTNNLVQIAKENPVPLALTGVGLAWLVASVARSSGSQDEERMVRYDRLGEPYQPQVSPYSDAAAYEEQVLALYAEEEAALRRAHAAAGEIRREPTDDDNSFSAKVAEARGKALSLKREAGETADKFKARVDDHVNQTESKIAELRRRAKTRADKMRADIDARATAMGDRAQAMGDRARAKADELGYRARAGYERGRAMASEQAHLMKQRADYAQERTAQMYHAEPLVAGAIGVVAGALLGALIPSSRIEDRYVGAHAQRLRRGAVDMATDAAKRAEQTASEAARAAADAAEDSARRQAGSV